MILTMIGKLSVDAAFNGIYLFTAELFPTEVRNSAFGTCSTFGRIGSITATFVGRELVRFFFFFFFFFFPPGKKVTVSISS